KRIGSKVRERRNALHSLQQHFLSVPRDGTERKQATGIPRFLGKIEDVCVSKIKYGMEPSEIVSSRSHTKKNGDQEKFRHCPPIARHFGGKGFTRTEKPKVKIDWQRQNQFSPVAKSESKKSSGQKRAWSDQCKIEGGRFPQERKTECNLPCTAEPEITPAPS